MNDDRARGLPLHDYADAVALTIPFRRAEPLVSAERLTVVRHLLHRLLADDTRAYTRYREAHDDSRLALRALLTIRPPSRLPEDFHAALDGVLEGELRDRGIVNGAALPVLSGAGGAELVLWLGDITTLEADAIVNAANAALLGCFRPMHACIDDAIHCGAGPRLRDDCATIMALQGSEEPTGVVKVTRGYNLPARYVFHTVGPIARGTHTPTNAETLARCYEACLEAARELGDVRTIAFCGISTGVFGYPKEPACGVAVATVRRWLLANPDVCDRVIFNVFSEHDKALYQQMLTSASAG